MKRYLFFLLVLVSLDCVAQNENVQRLKLKTKNVKVYLTGAEIIGTQTVKLQPGRNNVIFEEISPKLNSQSIQVTAPPEIAVLSISDNIDYLVKTDELPKVKMIKDSLKLMTQKITAFNDDKDAYTTEKNMLLQNQSIWSKEKGVPVAELEVAANFFRNRIKEINKQITSLNQKEAELNETIQRLQNQLYTLNPEVNAGRAEINVLLSSETASSATIEVKYLVDDAGWTPVYDLKAEDINKPIELIYRAKVFNNTLVPWNDVKITLSTGDPNLNAEKPKLDPWFLNYTQLYRASYTNVYQKKAEMQKSQKEYLFENNNINQSNMDGNFGTVSQTVTPAQPTMPSVVYEEIPISDFVAEFDIKSDYTVPADGKPYVVDVAKHNLPASYKHFAIAKQEKAAFLLAQITGWQDLNLVEGPANIYFGATYVGQSYIYTRNLSDTLDISLGRDKRVQVTRTRVKNYGSTSFTGSKRIETFAYEMVIKNNSKAPINIELQDQIPISQDSEIEVSRIELSSAEVNDLNGLCKWNYTIESGQSKKITLAFTIKHPKTKPITLEQTKTKKVARFL